MVVYVIKKLDTETWQNHSFSEYQLSLAFHHTVNSNTHVYIFLWDIIDKVWCDVFCSPVALKGETELRVKETPEMFPTRNADIFGPDARINLGWNTETIIH